MMMQAEFDDENHRSLNYTKFDRCHDNFSIDNDESYRQICSSTEHFDSERRINIKINLTNRFPLILLLFLFVTSQATALPIYQPSQNAAFVQQPPPAYPVAMVQLTDRSAYSPQSYNVYRRLSNSLQQQQINPIPSYSNGAVVQVYDQQQQQASAVVQNQQLRRERQRRGMIEKVVTIFDEDGQLSSFFSCPLENSLPFIFR